MKKFFFISFILTIFSLNALQAQVLEPGDGLRITFFNVSEEISGDYYIQGNNILQLPYIGLLQTTNKEYATLKTEVVTKYDSLYRGVELIVTPLYRISVLGEVRRSGVYYVTGVEKVLDVIAMAGGETEDSDISSIYVVRKSERITLDADDIIKGKGKADFYLKSGDSVYVTRKWWVAWQNSSFVFSAATLVVAILSLYLR